jgi:hypothetical protein
MEYENKLDKLKGADWSKLTIIELPSLGISIQRLWELGDSELGDCGD